MSEEAKDMHQMKGDKLLHSAILENNEKVVKFLLKHGVDPNARMYSTGELMHRLGSDNLVPETRVLFYNHRSTSITLSAKPCQPLSPLKYQTFDVPVGRRKRRLSCLNDKQEQQQSQEDYELSSPQPLHLAVANGRREIVELLLNYGADVNGEMDGEYTPLVVAVLLKHYELAELLVCHGANVNVRSKDGKAPIHLAVKTKQIGMVKLLLRNGADVNARSNHGVTALHIAVERKLDMLVELLLLNGSYVNAVTRSGVTPLHCAVVKGQREITEMLLSYGGDIGAVMKSGEIDVSPLLWLSEAERKSITEVLNRYIDKTRAGSIYGRLFRKLVRKFVGRK